MRIRSYINGMENKEKLFHFHLEDGYGNKKTLVCRLVDGAIKYSFYGGHGSSGTPFSLSNIQFHDVVNGNMASLRSEIYWLLSST